jgi:ABC transporter, permease protein
MKYFIKVCWEGLLFNKVRSAFTGLGVLIGVASVVLIFVLTNSFYSKMVGAAKNIFTIGLVSSAEADRNVVEEFGKPDIRKRIDRVRQYPEVVSIDFPEPSLTVNVVRENGKRMEGVAMAFDDSPRISEGIGFREATGNVVVAYRNPEFSDGFSLGEKFMIDGIVFTVVGYTNSVAGNGNVRFYLPSRLRHVVDVKEQPSSATFKVLCTNGAEISELREKTIEELNAKLDSEIRFVDITEEEERGLREISQSVGFFLGIIASISLAVASLNIINVMYIATLERSDEVAIYRSMGMTRLNISLLFLFEATMIVAIFAIAGCLFGHLLAWVILSLMQVPLVLSWSSLAIVLLVIILVGGGGGLYPARKAAKIDPVRLLS